jgi:hypothetical protein
MLAGVKAVTAKRREVDPTDECDLAVDDHELLVVTMHRTLMSIERTLHARAPHELLSYATNGSASGREEPHWRPSPQKNPYVDMLSPIAEKIAEPDRPFVTRQPEVGSDVPAGDMHMRASPSYRLSDARQRLGAVYQDLELAALTRRRIAGRPQGAVEGWHQLVEPPHAPKASPMMGSDCNLETLARPGVHSVNQGSIHDRILRRPSC